MNTAKMWAGVLLHATPLILRKWPMTSFGADGRSGAGT